MRSFKELFSCETVGEWTPEELYAVIDRELTREVNGRLAQEVSAARNKAMMLEGKVTEAIAQGHMVELQDMERAAKEAEAAISRAAQGGDDGQE